jgi:predicted nucleic acid-binding protein
VLSIDTNILLHAFNEDTPSHSAAYRWLNSLGRNEAVAISELILAEPYGLLRNPAVLQRPRAAREAVDVIQTYRHHPRWKLIGFPPESRPIHDRMWKKASSRDFGFRRLYDVRSALTMIAQGVTEFATVNETDFKDAGFTKVWNPLLD